jgi:hypothetical protein
MRRTYGAAVPLPTLEAWQRMTKQPARVAGNFDIEEEQRDGWTYQEWEGRQEP